MNPLSKSKLNEKVSPETRTRFSVLAKYIACGLMLLVAVTIISGCGGGDSAKALVGTWQYYDSTLELKKDGTFIYTQLNKTLDWDGEEREFKVEITGKWESRDVTRNDGSKATYITYSDRKRRDSNDDSWNESYFKSDTGREFRFEGDGDILWAPPPSGHEERANSLTKWTKVK